MGLMDSEIDDLKYEMEEEARTGTRIKVIGVGGGGCNAVARMVEEGLEIGRASCRERVSVVV